MAEKQAEDEMFAAIARAKPGRKNQRADIATLAKDCLNVSDRNVRAARGLFVERAQHEFNIEQKTAENLWPRALRDATTER
jgi:hypothetical protein